MSQAVHLRKYGVQATIQFELYEIDGVDLRTNWTPAQSDCEIEKNEGGYTICDNTASGTTTYKIVLTATEMEFARGALKIVDSATKAFLDKVVYIETYGNASAMHAFDLDTALASQTVGTCTTNTDMVGTNGAALASSYTATRAGYLDELAAANLPTDIADIPTVAEFEARTIVSDDYVVVGDTLARVTLTDTVTTYTGNTKQTGNNFPRLGAPAGASVSADIAAVKAETASIQTETTAIDALTKAAGDGDLAAIKVIIDALTAAGAAKLALGATTMITGIVSWDNTNATTTVIYSSDIIEATADHFNGRLFVPTSGALLGQYTDITDYSLDTEEGKFTVTAMTEPPADNTTFVIL